MRSFLLQILIAVILFDVQSSSATNADSSIYQARVYVEAGRLDDALNIIKTIEIETPVDNAAVAILLGKIFLAIDRPAHALEVFEEADFQSLDDPVVLIGIASANLQLGRFKDAKRFANAANRIDAESGDPELILALVEYRSGDTQASLSRMQQLIRTRPDSESMALVYAKYLALTGDPVTTLGTLRNYLKSKASIPSVLDYVSELEFRFGDKAHGLAMKKKAVQLFTERSNHFRKDVALAWLEANEATNLNKPKHKERPRSPQASIEDDQEFKKNELKKTHSGKQNSIKNNEIATQAQEVLFHQQRFPFPAGVTITGGSGFIVDGGKKIVTNRHVIEGGKEFAVRTGLGEMINAKVVYVSQTDDLAILELQKPLPPERAIPDNAYVKPNVGRPVVVMGYPLWYILGEHAPSLTNGLVSKATGMKDDAKTFQLTAKVNKGNSGGPVFDLQGNVVGITTGKLDAKKIHQEHGFIPEDVNFAIHIDRLPSIANINLNNNASDGEPLSPEALYKMMLGRVVMVATYK